MKSVKERINDLPEEVAKNLSRALESFLCCTPDHYTYCSDCPLSQEDGLRLLVSLGERIRKGKC